MPYVENEGTKIYWDERGEGEPLLLIMGWALRPTCGIDCCRSSPQTTGQSSRQSRRGSERPSYGAVLHSDYGK